MEEIVKQSSNTIIFQRRFASASAPNVHTGNDPAGDRGHILSVRSSLHKQVQSLNEDKENKVTFSVANVIVKLSCPTKFFVGSGHILNDLCASLWYSYLLMYFQNVVGFKSDYAAMLLLLGQIVDGIATPLVGYAEDKVHNCWLCKKNYGRFKSWHLIGSILVSCTFPFIFTECLGCSDKPDWVKMVYYSPFIALFQIGWAINQISHLALIPKVHPDENVRTELLAIRYGFTVCANVTIFIMTCLILGFKSDCIINKLDAKKFRNIALMAVSIGVIFTLIFHIFVKEESDEEVIRKLSVGSKLNIQRSYIQSRIAFPLAFQTDFGEEKESGSGLARSKTENTVIQDKIDASDPLIKEIQNVHLPAMLVSTKMIENSNTKAEATYSDSIPTKHTNIKSMKVKDWLKSGQFYNVAAIYTFTRLTVNLTQCYMPMYLQESLKLPCSTVATVPLTMFLAGLVVSIFIKYVNSKLGRMLSYLVGAILSVIGSLAILFLNWSPGGFLQQIGIFIVAALLGGGASALLVTSLAIAADLIGKNIESGAFVYGSMSFADKICCGLVIMLINLLAPCQNAGQNTMCGNLLSAFYRHVVGYSCGVCSVAGFLAVLLRSYYMRSKTNK